MADDTADYMPGDRDTSSDGLPEEASAAASPPPAFISHAGLTSLDPWDPRARRSGSSRRWLLGAAVETLDVLILALVMFLGVRFVAHNYVVEGGSMLPTFEQSDLVIVNRLAYRSFDLSWVPFLEREEWRQFGHPAPGDVVVFEYNGDPNERDFIKRVIAVPGQTVEVQDGVVIVDGVRLDEPYIAELGDYSYPATTVEPGRLFVLGDNRNNSLDSHIFGLVDESTVIGRADFRYWPAGRWGVISHDLHDQATATNSVGMRLAGAWQ